MRRIISFISVLFLCLLAFEFGADSIWAKYPERPIRFVAPFAPGGGSDMVARALTRYVNSYLDGKVFVENVAAGAGGAIGYREAARSAPDGYTLALMVTSLTVGPHVIKDYPSYDIFDPICIVAQDPIALIVKIDSRFKTAKDVISFAKAHPRTLSAAFAGIGTTSHLTIEAFAESIGTQFNLVPYKGTNPAVIATAGGHVDVGFGGCSESLFLVEGKKIRILLVFGSKRSRLYSDVPIAREMGYDVVTDQWRGVAVPRGTPTEIKEVLAEAFRKAMENEECKKLIDQMGLERVYLGPEQAGSWLKEQNDFFKGLAAKIGLQPK